MGIHHRTPLLLKSANTTMLAVHRKTGIDYGYLSRIFSGKQRPSLQIAQMIAAAIGWTLDDLVAGLSKTREDAADARLTAARQKEKTPCLEVPVTKEKTT